MCHNGQKFIYLNDTWNITFSPELKDQKWSTGEIWLYVKDGEKY